jgi:hypothetical protein
LRRSFNRSARRASPRSKDGVTVAKVSQRADKFENRGADEPSAARRGAVGDVKRRELDEIRRKLDGLVEAIADACARPGPAGQARRARAAQGGAWDGYRGAPASAPRLHPNLAKIYWQRVANLQDALADPATQSDALEIFCGLIERVTVQAETGFAIELTGEIANMVKLLPLCRGGERF